MTTYYSRVSYPYTGDTSIFSITFSFRRQTDIRVEVTDADGTITSYTADTDYEFINTSQISLKTLPAVGSTIEIYRDAKKDIREESFANGEVYTHELENSFNQDFEIAQEAYDLATKSVNKATSAIITSNTAMSIAEESAADSAAATIAASNAAIAADNAAASAEGAAGVAQEALDMAENSSHSHFNKNILNEIGETEAETPVFRGKELALADGSNASTEGYRELVGIPDVEADVAGIIAKQERILTGIAPQTIVQGNTCSIPAGWAKAWCDAPAVHIVKTGDQEVTIKAGLQVVGGYKGRAILSKVLESDHSIDLSFATGAYSFAIYADINEDGDFTLFGEWNASLHPLYVSNIYKDYSGEKPAMWYNPAECTSRYFTAEGVSAEICRVFIGEVYTDASGDVHNICNYQHGTSCIIPLNAGNSLSLNSWYYLYKPYRYLCFARAEVFAGRWNQTNWIYNGSLHASYGTVAMTIPSSSTVWVRTGSAELGSIPPAAPSTMPSGAITEGLGRLVMKRAW